MMQYVVGFLFNPAGSRVLRVRKARPAWCAEPQRHPHPSITRGAVLGQAIRMQLHRARAATARGTEHV